MRPSWQVWLKRLAILGAALAVLAFLALEAIRFAAVRGGVETVQLPQGSEIAARSPAADYADAYRAPLPHPGVSLDEVIAAASPGSLPVARSPNEVVYQGTAPGLRYLLSFFLDSKGETAYLTMSTVVFYDSAVGAAYFTPVKQGHKRLVPFALYRLVEALPEAVQHRPQPTPAAIEDEFRALLKTLDNERPGASVASLTEFMDEHRKYDIVTRVERQIQRLRSVASGRYHEAREIARAGDFDRAESMLEDLATHLPETSDGESAKQHLAFDFYLHKAQWLMTRQRWEEGEAVARLLVGRDLTREQAERVETILDGASQVGAALSQAARMQTRSACRQLAILLETRYVDEGAYPSNLSLSDVETWDPIGSRSILRALSAIEDYQRTDRGYSFVAVSAGGQDRIRVVDGAIEE